MGARGRSVGGVKRLTIDLAGSASGGTGTASGALALGKAAELDKCIGVLKLEFGEENAELDRELLDEVELEVELELERGEKLVAAEGAILSASCNYNSA